MACTWYILAIIVTSQFIGDVTAYSAGAPTDQCVAMTPGHGAAQTSNSPYSLDLGSVTSYTPGTSLTVTVTGGTFRGLIIQARKAGSTATIGTFEAPPSDSGLQLLTCGVAEGAVTHSSGDNKTDVVLTWNPPADDQGSITFVSSVVKANSGGEQEWWAGVNSGALSYGGPTTVAPPTTAGTTESANAAGSVMYNILPLLMSAILAAVF